jgi:protein SCO1
MVRKLMLILSLASVMMLAAACSTEETIETTTLPSYASELSGAVFDPPRVLSDFSMPSTTGDTFTLSEHRGEVILLYFGYRSCPDFCPTTFAELRQVYTLLNAPADKLKIAFITIDPERDTLEYLTPYTQTFHPDFIGLRTDGDALATLIDEFGVVATKRVVGESALSYMYDHTASIFLIGPNGTLEAQYLYGTPYRNIVHDLELILATL